MDDRDSRGPAATALLPRLFCAAGLRCAEVSGQLVLLDLLEGAYDVVNEVGAAMWTELTREPADRDLAALARRFGVAPSVVAADLLEFAASQRAAGRLVAERPPAAPASPVTPRRRPTASRALWERASAQRDLRKGFADAYAKRTGPAVDGAPPRVEVERLVGLFRTAEGIFPAREAPQDCLPRSLALTRFLRTAGWPARHVIGVALYPFEAHAWVELDGVPVNEGTTSLTRFTKIAQA